MVRDAKALLNDAALVAVRIQKDRTYNPDKHLKMTVPEFVMIFAGEHVTQTTAVGWFMYLNIPVWIE